MAIWIGISLERIEAGKSDALKVNPHNLDSFSMSILSKRSAGSHALPPSKRRDLRQTPQLPTAGEHDNVLEGDPKLTVAFHNIQTI